jgi:hypothetical protein
MRCSFESNQFVFIMATDFPSVYRNFTIRLGSVRRLLGDIKSYKVELTQYDQMLDKLLLSTAQQLNVDQEEYEIKIRKQREFINEVNNTLNDLRIKLIDQVELLSNLKNSLNPAQLNEKQVDEIEKANKLINQANDIINPNESNDNNTTNNNNLILNNSGADHKVSDVSSAVHRVAFYLSDQSNASRSENELVASIGHSLLQLAQEKRYKFHIIVGGYNGMQEILAKAISNNNNNNNSNNSISAAFIPVLEGLIIPSLYKNRANNANSSCALTTRAIDLFHSNQLFHNNFTNIFIAVTADLNTYTQLLASLNYFNELFNNSNATNSRCLFLLEKHNYEEIINSLNKQFNFNRALYASIKMFNAVSELSTGLQSFLSSK